MIKKLHILTLRKHMYSACVSHDQWFFSENAQQNKTTKQSNCIDIIKFILINV